LGSKDLRKPKSKPRGHVQNVGIPGSATKDAPMEKDSEFERDSLYDQDNLNDQVNFF
jgi:hypothetical protein